MGTRFDLHFIKYAIYFCSELTFGVMQKSIPKEASGIRESSQAFS